MHKIEDLLPIGTVVTLYNGTKTIMIVGRCLKDEENKMHDYTACFYPEGLISSNPKRPDDFFHFNSIEIERICYLGMVNEEEKEFKDFLKHSVEEHGGFGY